MSVRFNISVLLFTLLITLSDSCTVQKLHNHIWHFDTLHGWEKDHQDDNPSHQLSLDNGILKIFTRAHSWDRKKVRTVEQRYTTGRYSWKAYIPVMGMRDQASVGSWIYADDMHELDFEVGYGKEKVREELNAIGDEMLVYMTSQAFPFSSKIILIKPGWHIFEIDLTIKHSKYFASWWIDGQLVYELQLEYGSEVPFFIYCSVENLEFMGDHIPRQDNYGLFDYVRYRYHR